MKKPRRGDVWRVRLSDPSTGREALGTEIGAKVVSGQPQPERPCLIVSANDFNDESDGLTIVPLMEHSEGKEDSISAWAVAVMPGKEIEVDPANASYPSYEQLRKKSIIDCAQLWTVFAVEPSRGESESLPNDLCWDRRYGKLKKPIRVDGALQYLLGGCVRKKKASVPFEEGDVMMIDLPGRSHQRCLVVSSGLVDAIRQQDIWLPNLKTTLGQRTVVPLESDVEDIDHGVAPVEVSDPAKQSKGEWFFALCQEIYTIDWRARNAAGPVGHVDDMSEVRVALRQYLDLPK